MGKILNASLRTKIIGLVVFTLTLTALGSFFNLWREREREATNALVDLEENARQVGDSAAIQIYERYGDVQAFALSDSIQSLDAKRMQTDLNDYVKLYGIYDLILVVDASGHLRGVNTVDINGKDIDTNALYKKNYANDPWFKEAMAGQTTDDKEHAYSGTHIVDFLRDGYVSEIYGSDRFGSVFTAPIKDDQGKIVGVVSNRASSRWFEKDIFDMAQSLRKTGVIDARIRITNPKGELIFDYNLKDPKDAFNDDPNVLLKPNPNFGTIRSAARGSLWAEGDKGTQALSYVRADHPKWISSLGWIVSITRGEDEILQSARQALITSIAIFSMIAFIALTCGVWFGVIISKQIDNEILVLSKTSKEVSEASQEIATSSITLSESATEQAAALQETMAAVDEINAMIEKNAEAAGTSKTMSTQSREAAERGRSTVTNVVSAISQISEANEEIATQMSESNQQLSEITQLINDIGSKTKVINDIVFQTKLLSFNASVEAARAGEAGKGFAVVAEEVGSLAQMSGNAAKEISGLLDASVKKVESIVEHTRVKVDRLVSNSKEKVNAGHDTARECNDALEEILQNVSRVDTLVSEISVASQEQAQGIREISKAIGQMEQVTNRNSTAAQSASHNGERLNHQATGLDHVVKILVALVRGETASAKPAPKPTQSPSSPVSKSRPEPKKQKESKAGAKVVPFRQAKQTTKNEAPPAISEPVAQPMKKASGFDDVPNADDPGFKE